MNKAIPLALASFMFAATAQAETADTNTAADDCVNDRINMIINELAGMPGLAGVDIGGLDNLKAGCERETGAELVTTKDMTSFSKTVKGTSFNIK